MAAINNRPAGFAKIANNASAVLKMSEKGRQFIMDWEGLAREGSDPKNPAVKKLFPYDTAEKMVNHKFPPYSKEAFLEAKNSRKDWTIGYGHKIKSTEKLKYQDGINKPNATSLFNDDVAIWEDWIKRNILSLSRVKEKPLSQNQFDALASYVFNLGNIIYSTLPANKGKHMHTKLYDAFAAANYAKASEEMNVKTSGGKFNQGLADRRQAEREIWTKGIYTKPMGYTKQALRNKTTSIFQDVSKHFGAGSKR